MLFRSRGSKRRTACAGFDSDPLFPCSTGAMSLGGKPLRALHADEEHSEDSMQRAQYSAWNYQAVMRSRSELPTYHGSDEQGLERQKPRQGHGLRCVPSSVGCHEAALAQGDSRMCFCCFCCRLCLRSGALLLGGDYARAGRDRRAWYTCYFGQAPVLQVCPSSMALVL